MESSRPEPSVSYVKAKRGLIFFSGALLLSVWVGIQTTQKSGSTSLLPFQLESPEYLPHILAVIAIYYFAQVILYWIDQDAIIRARIIQKIDFFVSAFVGLFSIASFIFIVLKPLSAINIDRQILVASLASVALALFGAILSIAGSVFAKRWLSRSRARNEARLRTLLSTNKWMMHFNPAVPNAKKNISFKDDGSIGEGQNRNEYTWKTSEGFLEIYNLENKLQSRFAYNSKNKVFHHTNDKDTLSIPGQRIEMIN